LAAPLFFRAPAVWQVWREKALRRAFLSHNPSRPRFGGITVMHWKMGTLFVVLIGMVVMSRTDVSADDKDQKVHEGKVVKAENGKLTMTDKDGKNEHTHKVPATAQVSCDGKACKLQDLKKDFLVRLTTTSDAEARVLKVEAKSK
jgi:hypothetical protein